MTSEAERNPVTNFAAKLGVLLVRHNVVRVKFDACCPTVLTCSAISADDRARPCAVPPSSVSPTRIRIVERMFNAVIAFLTRLLALRRTELLRLVDVLAVGIEGKALATMLTKRLAYSVPLPVWVIFPAPVNRAPRPSTGVGTKAVFRRPRRDHPLLFAAPLTLNGNRHHRPLLEATTILHQWSENPDGLRL